jgi:threonine synthase
MYYFSTNDKNNQVNFKQAILSGLANDNGLFLPSEFPQIDKNTLNELKKLNIKEIASLILKDYVDIPKNRFEEIIDKTFSFDAPLKIMDDNFSLLELYHGPTFAFKDFGARFLANTTSYLLENSDKEIVVVVATSGDTGSAVASAFHNLPNSRVFLLYPSQKVSYIQEKQLTTFDNNITALEIEGTFDDCQKIVKSLLIDNYLIEKFHLTSANSINIGRLLPQVVYYFRAFSQLNTDKKIVFSVPSGNFGNLTAGIIAQKMGLPVEYFIASLNANDVFYKFLKTNQFEPKPSITTLANAMDVGNPSNFWRIWHIFEQNINLIRNNIHSYSFTDEQIIKGIIDFYEKYSFLIEPHSSCAYNGALIDNNNHHNIFLGTAHPAKFMDIIEKFTKFNVDIPNDLKNTLQKDKKSIKLPANFDAVKETILSK